MSASDDVALAIQVVRAAGEAILVLGDGGRRSRAKTVPTDVVTAADHAAQDAALALLAEQRPGDGVLSEEDASRPASAGRTWVLDPLDGTMNFARGLPGWCVAAALLADGEPTAAAVWDPVRGELFAAAAGHGATLNGAPLAVGEAVALEDAAVATFVDRARRPATVALAGRLAAVAGTLRMTGCGTLELAAVAAGRLDAWVQPDVEPWDWHPGALLVREAGGLADATAGDATAVHVAAAAPLHRALRDAL